MLSAVYSYYYYNGIFPVEVSESIIFFLFNDCPVFVNKSKVSCIFRSRSVSCLKDHWCQGFLCYLTESRNFFQPIDFNTAFHRDIASCLKEIFSYRSIKETINIEYRLYFWDAFHCQWLLKERFMLWDAVRKRQESFFETENKQNCPTRARDNDPA